MPARDGPCVSRKIATSGGGLRSGCIGSAALNSWFSAWVFNAGQSGRQEAGCDAFSALAPDPASPKGLGLQMAQPIVPRVNVSGSFGQRSA